MVKYKSAHEVLTAGLLVQRGWDRHRNASSTSSSAQPAVPRFAVVNPPGPTHKMAMHCYEQQEAFLLPCVLVTLLTMSVQHMLCNHSEKGSVHTMSLAIGAVGTA